MRFALDTLLDSEDDQEDDAFTQNAYSACSSPGSSINEISFVNPNEEDEDVPQLYLPRKKPVQPQMEGQRPLNDATVERLDPELEQLIQRLDLQAKLPVLDRPELVLSVNRRSQMGKNHADSGSRDTANATKVEPEQLLSAIQSSFATRLAALEQDNRIQVEKIRLQKRQEVEERKHKEEEGRRRREEEERRRREEEEKRRQKVVEEEKRKKEAERLKKEKEEAQAREEQAKKRAEEEEKSKQEEIRAKTVSDFGAIEKTFKSYKEKIISIKKDIIEPVKKADPSLKSLLSRHKRKVNPKFGQLTNSNTQLRNIQNELCALVDQTKENQLAFLWILNFIAKAMVHQAETEVRVKPESALPLGKLAVNLMVKYPELKELLIARFVKKCPFVIGYTCSIDSESGRQNMGWKRKADEKWEEETFYDERMGGMVTLFAVITRLSLPQELINVQSHPLPIANSWSMLARIANTSVNLLTNSHFVVLGFWWDAAASEFIQAYGIQGSKLLRLVGEDLTGSVADRKYVGAARLRILLEEWQTTGIKTFPELVA